MSLSVHTAIRALGARLVAFANKALVIGQLHRVMGTPGERAAVASTPSPPTIGAAIGELDPAPTLCRPQAMFQPAIPSFTQSAQSYALSRRTLDRLRELLAAIGLDRDEAVDLWTALVTGLASQQAEAR